MVEAPLQERFQKKIKEIFSDNILKSQSSQRTTAKNRR